MDLLKSLVTIGSMTLVSRILGFLRDAIIARHFGAGVHTDVFFVAFKIPNLLRRMFAEGAFSQAFVPIFGEYTHLKEPAATRAFVDQVASALTLTVVVISSLGILAAPWIAYLSAPGFRAEPDKLALTITLLRIVFPYIVFISLVALVAGILNSYSRFSAPAFTPSLLNVAMIAASLWLAPYFDPPILALGWGVALGGVLQLVWLIPHLRKLGLLPRPTLRFVDPGVKRILKLMAPAMLGVSVAQLSLLLNTIFASFLEKGSISWLYYADRLMEFPSGLLGVALGTILLPSLAKHYADGSPVEYSRLLDWGLRLTLLLALPAAVALAALAMPLVATLFHYGEFEIYDVWMTREAVVAYSLGLPGLILVKVLAPGFYARQDIRTPVRIALVMLAATQVMNLLFIGPLRHAGLALAIGLSACLNAGTLLYLLKSRGIYMAQAGWPVFVMRVTIAISVMYCVLWLAAGDSQWWLAQSFNARIVRLLGLVIAGAGSYFLSLYLMGLRLAHYRLRAPA